MKEIEENNKLIAEFMGYQVKETPSGDIGLYYELVKGGYHYSQSLYDTKYHTSWDALMPVIEKIESFGHKVIIFSDETWIEEVYETDEPLKRNIEIVGINRLANTYAAVIQFIQWYN